MSWRPGLPKRVRQHRLLCGAALALVLSTPALAQAPADIRVERAGANVRLILDYPDSYQESRPTADVCSSPCQSLQQQARRLKDAAQEFFVEWQRAILAHKSEQARE